MNRVKVSIALHKQEPDLNGNQREWEVPYMNYNRANAIMEIDENGDGFIHVRDLAFPNNGEDITQVALFFSVGVAVAPAGRGGSIIICDQIGSGPIVISKGVAPLLTLTVGVHKARLDEMRADGRFFDFVDPDYARGINLPDRAAHLNSHQEIH